MNNFSYETISGMAYLVYSIPQDEDIDSVSINMLTHNKVPGLASVIFSQIDDVRYVKYNVMGKIPARDFLMKNVTKDRLFKLLRGICQAVISAEDYMIEATSLLLDLDYIFTDISTGDASLICVPVVGFKSTVDVCELLKEIVFTAKYDLSESNEYVATIINYLNSPSLFTLNGFLELISKASDMKSQPIKPAESKPKKTSVIPPSTQPNVQKDKDIIIPPKRPETVRIPPSPIPAPINPQNKPSSQPQKNISLWYLLQHYNKDNAMMYKKQKEEKKSSKNNSSKSGKGSKPPKEQYNPGFNIPSMPSSNIHTADDEIKPSIEAKPLSFAQHHMQYKEVSGNFGDTVFAGTDDDDTTRFDDRSSQPSAIVPTLIRKRNNERIRIDSPIFRIGRDSSFNNYAVTDNHFVGHTHCHIISRDGEFFLVDDNSKNHTFLDGQQIPPSTEIKLSHGQKIRLSDEEFEFLLY